MHSAFPSTDAARDRARMFAGADLHRRSRERGAAGNIEMAGENVQQLHGPTGERAEFLCRRAEPSVNGTALCSGKLARQTANGRGRNAATPFHGFGAKTTYRGFNLIESLHEAARVSQAHQLLS